MLETGFREPKSYDGNGWYTTLFRSTLLTSWFSEPRCQHFGKPFSLSSVLYFAFSFLPSSVSYVVVIRFMFVFINFFSSYGKWNKFAGLIKTRFKLCLKSALCLFRAHFLKLPGYSRACQLTRTVFRLLFWAQSTKLPNETEISF